LSAAAQTTAPPDVSDAWSRGRLAGGWTVALAAGTALGGAALLIHVDAYAPLGLATAMSVPLFGLSVLLKDTSRNRTILLLYATVFGVTAAVTTSVWGDRSVPFLLVTPLIVGGLSFTTERTPEGTRRFRDLDYLSTAAGVVALAPTFVGGIVLIAEHDLSGTALAALLIAPYAYFVPTVWVFFDIWSKVVFVRTQEWWARVALDAGSETHKLYGEPAKAVAQCIRVSEKYVSLLQQDQLHEAWRRANDAFRRAQDALASELSAKSSKTRRSLLRTLSGNPGLRVASWEAEVGVIADIRAPKYVPTTRGKRAVQWAVYTVGPARQLNKPLVLAISLYMMVWLRAGILLGCPSFAYASFSPYLPHRYATLSVSNVIWLFAAAWALGVAIASPIIQDALTDPSRGRFFELLLASETTIAIAVVIAKPSWPVAVFFAGPLNWISRPHAKHRVENLARAAGGLVAAFLIGALAVHGAGWLWWQKALELGAAFVAVLAIGTSYGLMFPLVLRAVVALRRLRRESLAIRREVYRAAADMSARALSDAEDILEALLKEHEDNKDLRDAIGRARDAHRKVVKRPGSLTRSRAWTLRATIDRASQSVPPPPLGRVDREGGLYRYNANYAPPELASVELGTKAEQALALTIRCIVDEAAWYGEGKFKIFVKRDANQVDVMVANGLPAIEREGGAHQGAQHIESAIEELDGRLIYRGKSEAPDYPFKRGETVYMVRFSFSTAMLLEPEREEAAWLSV
jgi:hypothetical protein